MRPWRGYTGAGSYRDGRRDMRHGGPVGAEGVRRVISLNINRLTSAFTISDQELVRAIDVIVLSLIRNRRSQ